MVSVILLAGGLGTRLNRDVPKQYLKINSKEIALYSFECFLSMHEIIDIVVVCAEEYRFLFRRYETQKKICFANPGLIRQESVYNGFITLKSDCSFVCIHDAARPIVNNHLVRKVIEAARIYRVATAATHLKFTIKECDSEGFVTNTPDRTFFREIQTPQVMEYTILKEGLQFVRENRLTVTDDVSMAELLKYQVKLVQGDDNNIKITTPQDLIIVNKLLQEAQQFSNA